MKKEVVTYKNGEFVDYMGNTHKFVVAGVSTSNFDITMNMYDEYGDDADLDYLVPKGVFIGIAVCNPKDEFDEEKGKMIAYNKAVHVKNLNHPAMYSTRPGFINTAVVDALLDNIVNYISKDPGSVIPGYNDAEKKHAKKVEDELFVKNSSEELRNVAEKIKLLSKEDKNKLDKLVSLL